MKFDCLNLDNYGLPLGKCTLPANHYDEPGTEHMFGDVTYVLVETTITAKRRVMYFRKKQ